MSDRLARFNEKHKSGFAGTANVPEAMESDGPQAGLAVEEPSSVPDSDLFLAMGAFFEDEAPGMEPPATPSTSAPSIPPRPKRKRVSTGSPGKATPAQRRKTAREGEGAVASSSAVREPSTKKTSGSAGGSGRSRKKMLQSTVDGNAVLMHQLVQEEEISHELKVTLKVLRRRGKAARNALAMLEAETDKDGEAVDGEDGEEEEEEEEMSVDS